ASVIVQGTSFALHKFAALTENGASDRVSGWERARSVDSLVVITAGIAAFGFLTLWSFGLKPIRELGLTAALGCGWLVLLAVFFLPALDIVATRRSPVSTLGVKHLTRAQVTSLPFGLSLFQQGSGLTFTLLNTGLSKPGRLFGLMMERLVSGCYQ